MYKTIKICPSKITFGDIIKKNTLIGDSKNKYKLSNSYKFFRIETLIKDNSYRYDTYWNNSYFIGRELDENLEIIKNGRYENFSSDIYQIYIKEIKNNGNIIFGVFETYDKVLLD
jgi:hypothetical protein